MAKNLTWESPSIDLHWNNFLAFYVTNLELLKNTKISDWRHIDFFVWFIKYMRIQYKSSKKNYLNNMLVIFKYDLPWHYFYSCNWTRVAGNKWTPIGIILRGHSNTDMLIWQGGGGHSYQYNLYYVGFISKIILINLIFF